MDYKQINCSLFDRIEFLAITKKLVSIIYLKDGNGDQELEGYIKNIFSENKAEYILINSIKIRLDKIITISEK